MAKKIVGIIANTEKSKAPNLLRALDVAFSKRDIKPLVEKLSAELVGRDDGVAFPNLAEQVDVLIVLGGDGTILNVVHRLQEKAKPILGINIGTLGFLTTSTTKEIDAVVDAICDDSLRISERTLLQVRVSGTNQSEQIYYGLNEVTISRGSVSRMVGLETKINGEPVSQFRADGLIISTPTGSTAYSLSAGGPIIEPSSSVFVITPICPHSLTDRSLVVNDDSELDVYPLQRGEEVILTVDGQIFQDLRRGSHVKVRKAPFKLPLASTPDQTFFKVLRQKLRWHQGPNSMG